MNFGILNLLAILLSTFSVSYAKYCSSNYSGYVLETRIYRSGSVKNDYFLVLCIDGKFIFEKRFEKIAWSEHFDYGGKVLTFLRKKQYASRDVPIFYPEATIGGLFEVIRNKNGSSIPVPLSSLVAVPITNSWTEVQMAALIYHIPLLITPDTDESGWEIDILMHEERKDDVESKLGSSRFVTQYMLEHLPKTLISLMTLSKKTSVENYNSYLSNLNKLLYH